MAVHVTVERDATGLLQASAGKSSDRLLALLLTADLQEDRRLTERLLRLLRDPAAAEAEFLGNAHRVHCLGERVTVTSLFDAAAPSRSLTRAELAELVSAWLALLQ